MLHATRRRLVLSLFGFLSLFGTTLWAVTFLPAYFRAPVAVLPAAPLPFERRINLPNVMAWFFIQYPYLSPDASVAPRNHHTYVVTDAKRGREYVVVLGQSFRRVEIYYASQRGECQVQVFSPGRKRVVWMRNGLIERENVWQEANDWMWQQPLWNPVHLKIYALAEFWKDSPYRRFSCAGFVHEFLQNAGVSIPLLDAWDIDRQHWREVPVSELEPGDIIAIRAISAEHRRFWHHRVTHVGIYLGGGKIIHAATSSFHSSYAWVKVADLKDFHGRIDKALRPPELN